MRARGPDREGVVERDGVRVGSAVYGKGEPAILLLTSGQDDRSDGAPGVLRERLTGYEEDPIGPGHDRYMGLRAADPPEEPPAARDGS